MSILTQNNNGAAAKSLESTPERGRIGLQGRLALEVPHRRGSQLYDAALMRLRVRMDSTDAMGYTLGVTSCGRGTGVSTFTANLAIRAADLQFGPVLLVDAHPLKSSMAQNFGVSSTPGVGEALSGAVPWEDCLQQSAVKGLDLMTLGGKGLLERACVETERIEMLVKHLRAEYPVVMFDFPDVPNMLHTLLLGQQMDGVLLAVRSERVRRVEAATAARRLRSDGINLIGAVLTRQRKFVPQWLEQRL